MKTIALKLFLVICCQFDYKTGTHLYEVKNINDTTYVGTIYSNRVYNMNDTIPFKFSN